MKLISGSSNPNLTRQLSDLMDAPIAEAEVRRFPDGELYARIVDDISGEDVCVIQSTYPDDNALEFLILTQLARDLGGASVTGVIPYYGYARQDRAFKDGESFTARTMARHIQMAVDRVVCVNLHKEAILQEFTDAEPVHVSVMSHIGEFMKQHDIQYILAPDKGAVEYARQAAEAAGCDYTNLEKKRLDGRTVSMVQKDLEVKGKRVCIIDDIIATGGTIMRASKALREQGARSVFACCAHGLFTGGGRERLEKQLDGLYSTDTIENPTSSISASAAIAGALLK